MQQYQRADAIANKSLFNQDQMWPPVPLSCSMVFISAISVYLLPLFSLLHLFVVVIFVALLPVLLQYLSKFVKLVHQLTNIWMLVLPP